MSGWIKLHKKLLNSQMYKHLNLAQRDVFIQILISANWEENEWEWGGGIHRCKPGQFITSLASLKKKCAKCVTIKQIRTALLKLEKWQFLANESTKTGRLITVLNWDTYQREETDGGQSKRQREGKDRATIKNNKEDKDNTIRVEVLDKWNKFAQKYGLQTMQSLSKSRYSKFKTRVKEGMEFSSLLDCIKDQSFLIKGSANGDRKWRVSFDWLVANDTNWVKVSEYFYGRDDIKKTERLL